MEDTIQKKALGKMRDTTLVSDNLYTKIKELARLCKETDADFVEVKLTFGQTENAQEKGYALELTIRVVSPTA